MLCVESLSSSESLRAWGLPYKAVRLNSAEYYAAPHQVGPVTVLPMHIESVEDISKYFQLQRTHNIYRVIVSSIRRCMHCFCSVQHW